MPKIGLEVLFRLLARVLHRFAHSWPLSAFQNFSKTCLQVLFRHFPEIGLRVLFSHMLKNWPISTLQICSKLACNCLSSYLPQKWPVCTFHAFSHMWPALPLQILQKLPSTSQTFTETGLLMLSWHLLITILCTLFYLLFITALNVVSSDPRDQ